MNRFYLSAAALGVALIVIGSSRQARALSDDYTIGDFENLKYVGNQISGTPNYNLTVASGQINDGPTPDAITATSSASSNPPNADYPPPGNTVPSAYPALPGGGTAAFGNWDQVTNTGFGDWGFNSQANFSNSTTTGVTHGTTAIAMDPNFFGQGTSGGNYTQHLALKVQNIGAVPAGNTQLTRDTTTSDADYANIVSHKYLAIDVTFKSSDWTHGTFANTGAAGSLTEPGAVTVTAYMNSGFTASTTPLGDRVGFQNLGQYQQNNADPTTGINRTPDVDSRQSLLGGTAGVYDPGNHTGTYTTTLYFDYSHWQAPGSQAGGPPSGTYYDLRNFFNNTTNVSGTNGYLELMFATGYDNGYTAGKFYFDNMRVTNEELRLGDFNNDGHINAADISAAEAALANPAGYAANPTGLSGVTLSAQDMLTIGDVNGDGKFTNADLQAFVIDLKNGLGSIATVPEPTSLVLLGLAVPVTGFVARKGRRRRAA